MPVTVLNMHHLPNKELPPGDASYVYIGRPRGHAPLGLGNPFRVGAEYKQGEAVEAFRDYARDAWSDPRSEFRQRVMDLARRSFAGEDLKLVCWCKPRACHGDVLKDAIDHVVARMQAASAATPPAPSAEGPSRKRGPTA